MVTQGIYRNYKDLRDKLYANIKTGINKMHIKWSIFLCDVFNLIKRTHFNVNTVGTRISILLLFAAASSLIMTAKWNRGFSAVILTKKIGPTNILIQ